MAGVSRISYSNWRVVTLVGVHLLFIAHFVHWKINGRTLAPLEFNEVLYTVHQGIVTAGFILMAVVMVGTLVFGRFFCSWGCHILALQDAAGWILDKLRIKRQPIRSRTLIWVPIGVMFYLFIWPQILQAWHGVEQQALHVAEAGGSRWSSFTTDDMWRNLPPPGVAVLTFFVCGFVIVYLLGSRGFCFQACPYGALFGIADQLAPGRIVLTKDCSQCGLCTKACSSDILVHRELAQHGMVTNPRCLKDLDCVSACPEQAVRFGFRMPPLFRKGHPMGAYGGRFSNTLGEDVFMAIAFLVAMPVYRGLYDAVPFLLAVALALCTAWLFVLAWRLLRRGAVQFRGITLKMDRELRTAGRFAAIAVALVGLFFAHSSWVQYHTLLGKRLFARVASHAASPLELQSAIAHYEAALRVGIINPVDRRFELASMHQQRGDAERSAELLQGILSDNPDHAEARFRLGEFAHSKGDFVKAMHLWSENLDLGADCSGMRSSTMLARSAVALGAARESQGDTDGARSAYDRGIARVPGDAELLIASGALAHRTGRIKDAIQAFDEAMRNGGPEDMLRNNLGALHLQQGRADLALPHLERLVVMHPTDARLRYTLGMVHARAGRTYKAEEQLVAAARIAPDDARVRQALAALNAPENATQP
ncbi:MAG: tetratricopeptide repeat protein [Flavobacteriales bacterium]|jgi:tetratricopeptide (TPR) repeat protein/polyferredoxin|nr:tetratricopeptide repeat protein [Flavobacteriales bacterium]